MAGGYSLNQILGYVTLTGLIQATKSGIPDTLPPKMMTRTKECLGDSGRYTRVTGERRTASLVMYGASAVEANLRNVATVDVKLLHCYMKQPIPPLVMQQIRQFDSYEVQKQGMQEVTRQVKMFGTRFKNTRIAVAQQVLANGVLYWDGSGNLLPSSSGAVYTHSFQMNGNNQNQLNGIIGASWAASNTNIPQQLVKLEQKAIQLTGYPLKYIFYGAKVPTYLTNNDFVIDYLARQPTMNVEWLDNPGQIPQGLFGYTWVPMYTAFFDQGTTGDQNTENLQQIWNDNLCVFAPEISDDWWELLEGSFEVPTTINLLADGAAAMASMKLVHGMFAYGQASHDPPGVMSYQGDTHLPVLKVPDAIYQGVVAGF